MTTIIFRAGKLYTDSRMTTYADGTQFNDIEKMYEPELMHIGQRKVLCLAACGDVALLKYIKLMDAELVKIQHNLDIMQPEFWAPIQEKLRDNCNIVAVTASRVFGLSVTKDKVEIVYEEKAPLAVIVAGSGKEVPGVFETAVTVSAELAMADAIAGDPQSGGPVVMWTYGKKGFRTLELSPAKKFNRWMIQKLAGVVFWREMFSMVKARIRVYPKAEFV
jgi:hypothetical protein